MRGGKRVVPSLLDVMFDREEQRALFYYEITQKAHDQVEARDEEIEKKYELDLHYEDPCSEEIINLLSTEDECEMIEEGLLFVDCIEKMKKGE